MSATSPAHHDVRRTPYRHDLDGLRGIAIALVVVFHVYVGRVSGGVDVFLLLSGYFFLGSLIRHADRPDANLNPWWSIWRTLRRLYPSLAVVVGACTAFVLWRLPEIRSGDLAEQLTATLLYRQNDELAEQAADYAAADDGISPLQHLWSMSVQAQFYLGAILLVTAVAAILRLVQRVSRDDAGGGASPGPAAGPGPVALVMTPLLVAVTIASFAWAAHLHEVNQMRNYYSTAARLWEMGLGALLGLLLGFADARAARQGADAAAGRDPGAAARLLARIAVPLGVILIAATGFVVDGAAEFPGPWTLVPLGGAALVIIGGRYPGWTRAALASRPARFLGDIAYALYLWHWPLLILGLRVAYLDEPTPLFGAAVIAASVILAWATHVLVERPLLQRTRRPSRADRPVRDALALLRGSRAARARAAAGVAVAVVAVLLVSASSIQGDRIDWARALKLDPVDYPGALAVTDGAAVPRVRDVMPPYDVLDHMWPRVASEGCITTIDDAPDHIETQKDDGTPCVYGDPDGSHVMTLVGGSHSEQWFSPLETIARENGWRLEVMLKPGCAATLEPIPEMGDDCVTWSAAVAERLTEQKPDVVVTTTTRPGSDNTDYTPDGYRAFWAKLADAGIPVLGFRDTPWPVDDDLEGYVPAECVVAGGNPVDCGPLRERSYSPVDDGIAALADHPGSMTVDVSDILCGPVHCPAVIGNVWVYRDDDHLSDHFARSMTAELRRLITPYLKNLEAGRP
ncbi:acyltransferase family protein [Corynebacterium sp.]|uniref:acyltransferase family protein n=1 Tax=Corynebacterium sp. TaxID=1720 RepID=UPI0026DBFF20|nr:acyltransferase family protein [Corynebacterium sp.]MDO4610926.1 acyltransferase family protein [Corynebacterium sp.]